MPAGFRPSEQHPGHSALGWSDGFAKAPAALTVSVEVRWGWQRATLGGNVNPSNVALGVVGLGNIKKGRVELPPIRRGWRCHQVG